MWEMLKQRAETLERETMALFYAYRDPRTPWYARALVAALLAYAVSPIDLVPDPIPVLGLLDDLVIIPAGVALLLRLVPAGVMADARRRAAERPPAGSRTLRWAGAAMVALVWLAVLWLVARTAWGALW